MRKYISIQAGDVVSIPLFGLLDHPGIVTERYTVISSSQEHGKVMEQSLKEFADGKTVSKKNQEKKFPSHTIVANARKLLGKEYDLLTFNCDHLVSLACTGKKSSDQLKKVGTCLGVLAVIAILR